MAADVVALLLIVAPDVHLGGRQHVLGDADAVLGLLGVGAVGIARLRILSSVSALRVAVWSRVGSLISSKWAEAMM